MGKDNIVGKSIIVGAIEGVVISVLEAAGKSVKESGVALSKIQCFQYWHKR